MKDWISRKIQEFTEMDKFKSKKSNINKFLSSFIKNRKGVYEIIDGKIYLQIPKIFFFLIQFVGLEI